ncbi:MAG TPA: FtsK/SpoIIIE domain-containing protein [Nitriliruptorales bacterium]
MRLTLQTAEGPRDVVLEVAEAGATVGDLLNLLASDAAGLVIEDRYVARDHTLQEAGLHDGAVVQPGDAAPAPCPPHPGPWLVSTGGLDAGRWWPLALGRLTLGRDAGCEVRLDSPTVSGRHADLLVGAHGVEIADLGATNGTWLDGAPVIGAVRVDPGRQVRVGAVSLEVVAHRPSDTPAQAVRHLGAWTFNRPPRPVPEPAPPPISPPVGAVDAPPAHGPGWASLLTPVVMAGAMALLFDNPLFALFALVSPLTIVGSWWEARRRSRSDGSREAQRLAQELDRFRAEVRGAVAAERRRRLDLAPHPAEVVRRATGPSTRVWERRPGHHDAFVVGIGVADVPYHPEIAGRHPLPAGVDAIVEEHGGLRRAALPIDLRGGGVVGLVGERAVTVAVARCLALQLAVHHGPADLALTAFLDDHHLSDWSWAAWLPHARDPGARDRDRVVTDRAAAEALAEGWLAEPATAHGRARLVVVDAPAWTEGRRAALRAVLAGDAGPVAGIVVATSADRLPASCRYVVEAHDEDGSITLSAPGDGSVVAGVLAWGVSSATARAAARRLARLEDPESVDPAADLPRSVALARLLPGDPDDPEVARAHWRGQPADPGLPVPLGVGPDGPLWLDLVTDGPHALIGGTTGSGKSELLRSVVVGLAAQVDPAHLNIVLVDYKGGSAFDVCADLPHTVGVVTDLDEHLGARALRCLEAELRHRESVLRGAGAPDLPSYLSTPAAEHEPLPRLLVVIDEFATVAAELPDFLHALVGIAQRGRSLGVHLILATQRPSGVIDDDIRANTNLRIALRVQEQAESTDLVGVPDAAHVPRDLPGRAYVRLGPGEVTPLQTAYASGRTDLDDVPVRLRPWRPGAAATGSRRPHEGSSDQPTDLERLVGTLGRAAAAGRYREPRTPWPDPLPDDLRLDELLGRMPEGSAGDAHATVALLDEPDRQRQTPTGWDLHAGNLLVFGIPGSGTTTTLASIALALARSRSPDDLHLYVLDAGRGELRALQALPHVGAVVTSDEDERQRRLVGILRGEVERRRTGRGATGPRIVLLLDGYGAFAAAFEAHHDREVLDGLERVLADGPGVGVHVAASATRAGDVPGAVLSGVAQRWLHRLADTYDFSTFGVPPAAVPDLPPGRVILAGTQAVAQVARAPDLDRAVEVLAARTAAAAGPGPMRVRTLPEQVTPAMVGQLVVDGDAWHVPLGIGGDDLRPTTVTLHPGEHLLVAGPARSGRSSVMAAIGELAATAGIEVVTLAHGRSPLRGVVGCSHLEVDEVAAWAGSAARVPAALLLVDDADLVEDHEAALARLAKDPDSGVRIVAAGRADALRAAYGHWTRAVRGSSAGLLLVPDVDLDGDLLGTRLPRRSPVPPRPGAGWLLHAAGAVFVQAVQRPRPRT